MIENQQVAEKRNVALLETDPVRPFLSSTVAANLAEEQVKLKLLLQVSSHVHLNHVIR